MDNYSDTPPTDEPIAPLPQPEEITLPVTSVPTETQIVKPRFWLLREPRWIQLILLFLILLDIPLSSFILSKYTHKSAIMTKPTTIITPTPSLSPTPDPSPTVAYQTNPVAPIKTPTPSSPTSTPTPTKTQSSSSQSSQSVTTTDAPTCGASSIPPPHGSAPLQVTLFGSGDGGRSNGVTGYQWDFDGNGSWDTDESSVSLSPNDHTYTDPGTFHPIFRVKGGNGKWSGNCNYPYEVVVDSPSSPTATPTP